MPELLTIGHSTHSLGEFLSLLRGAGVELVADVRRFPGSRRHPHFGGEALAASLAEAGIGYEHLAELGGRRSVAAGPPNDGRAGGALPRHAHPPRPPGVALRRPPARRGVAPRPRAARLARVLAARGRHVRGGAMVALPPPARGRRLRLRRLGRDARDARRPPRAARAAALRGACPRRPAGVS